ncbi:MAG: response regulator transcription factor, partial [Anaerolineales bacterium]|nr:response regulator transcription factor [Anaerolineales bacterium]
MSEEHLISVLVVEDHAVVREGLCALVDSRSELQVAGEAADGVEAVEKALALKPDVILMDLIMPRMDGIEAISEIMGKKPGMKILVLTSFSEEEKVVAAIQAGALGYILKECTSKELVNAILDVYQEKLVLHPALTRSVIRKMGYAHETMPTQPLTKRENEVLELVAQGLSNRNIADSLYISDRTVARHVSNLLIKLGLENRTQAALYA